VTALLKIFEVLKVLKIMGAKEVLEGLEVWKLATFLSRNIPETGHKYIHLSLDFMPKIEYSPLS